ncbi:hypothetical protein [Ekhidna sp.]|jgi:hypothetical protein|uniref:hypothetical protein n=1 Tax=Ekhidna sp. TaxID=2608089 RepID=UPI003B5972DD
MKATKIITTVLLGLAIGLYSCNDDDMHNGLSQADLESLNGLREAYTNAVNENEAFKISIQDDDLDGIHLHDSLFHHFQNLYEEHHENYSHENGHDDHHHDTDGMHMGSNGMNGHDDQDGHHAEDHELMDGLMGDHEAISH